MFLVSLDCDLVTFNHRYTGKTLAGIVLRNFEHIVQVNVNLGNAIILKRTSLDR